MLKILNWNKLFTYIFGSYSPDKDTQILKEEEFFWVKYALVIRKTIWFSILSSWDILLSWLILFINVFLLYKQNLWWFSNSFLSTLLIINVIYWFFVYFKYLIQFSFINKKIPKIDSIYKWIQRSEKWDSYFISFFNQTITNIIVFLIVFWYIIFSIIFSWSIQNSFWFWLNVLLLIIQIILLLRIKSRIQNQEMDFVIITTNKLYLYDQMGYLDVDKNEFPISKIRNVKWTFWNNVVDKSLLWSILKYWTLKFLLEWGWSSEWDVTTVPTFQYTPKLEETQSQVALFVDEQKKENWEVVKKYKNVIHNIPVVLTKILYSLKIDIDKNLDRVLNEWKYKNEIKEYLQNNKEEILKKYVNWNEHIKKEIENLRIIYLK